MPSSPQCASPLQPKPRAYKASPPAQEPRPPSSSSLCSPLENPRASSANCVVTSSSHCRPCPQHPRRRPRRYHRLHWHHRLHLRSLLGAPRRRSHPHRDLRAQPSALPVSRRHAQPRTGLRRSPPRRRQGPRRLLRSRPHDRHQPSLRRLARTRPNPLLRSSPEPPHRSHAQSSSLRLVISSASVIVISTEAVHSLTVDSAAERPPHLVLPLQLPVPDRCHP